MRIIGKRGRTFLLGSCVAALTSLGSHAAHASKVSHHDASDGGSLHRSLAASSHEHHRRTAHEHRSIHHKQAGEHFVHVAGISCVPYARQESGIEISGNAAQWWHHAEGVYARGNQPEVGSVLNFRANGHMRLGHVAVVASIIDSRNILVDHANWGGPGLHHGMISRGVRVEDVSANNDWSSVRVQLVTGEEYGSVYATYGFIYARADGTTSQMAAANHAAHVMAAMASADLDDHHIVQMPQQAQMQDNVVQRDLHIIAMRDTIHSGGNFDEVAEAPTRMRQQSLDLRIYRDMK
jgi:surface antigen